jgi:thiamine-phosphate pyrophosphorylase
LKTPALGKRPLLCAVLDVASFGGDPFTRATEVFDAGADWIQLRERTAPDLVLFETARLLVEARYAANKRDATRPRRVIVNKRADIARAAHADGVHLGFDALGPDAMRAALGTSANVLAGRSLHDLAEVAHLAQESEVAHSSTESVSIHDHNYDRSYDRVDYVHLAPIWAPNSKPASRPPHGPEMLASACRLGIPVFAQGGIDPSRAREAVLAGVTGVAVTGELARGGSPTKQLEPIRAALDRAYADQEPENV